MGTFKGWLGGIISAAAGALSGVFGAGMADPADFNVWTIEGRRKLIVVALYAAAPPVLAYLARSPLPGITEPTTVTTTTATVVSHPSANVTAVKTIEQVKTEPTDPKKSDS